MIIDQLISNVLIIVISSKKQFLTPLFSWKITPELQGSGFLCSVLYSTYNSLYLSRSLFQQPVRIPLYVFSVTTSSLHHLHSDSPTYLNVFMSIFCLFRCHSSGFSGARTDTYSITLPVKHTSELLPRLRLRKRLIKIYSPFSNWPNLNSVTVGLNSNNIVGRDVFRFTSLN